MTIRKRYCVMRRTFDTLDAALAYASLIFERTGLVVEIGEIRSAKRRLKMMTTINIGDRVEGGNTPEDYDTGTVLDITGGVVLVAWDSGVRTSQPAELLRPEGSCPLTNH